MEEKPITFNQMRKNNHRSLEKSSPGYYLLGEDGKRVKLDGVDRRDYWDECFETPGPARISKHSNFNYSLK